MSDETVVLACCIVSAIAWAGVGFVVARKHSDGLHLATIFCMLFAFGYPLKLIATSYGFASLDSVALGEEWRLRALGLANLSAAMFALPLIFGARALSPVLRSTGQSNSHPRSAAVGWFLAAMILLIGSYGFDSPWRVLSFEALTELRERRDQSRPFSAVTALMRDTGTFCLITHFGAVIRQWKDLLGGIRAAYVSSWAAVAYLLLAISGSKYMGLLPFAIAVLVANAIHIERYGRGYRFSRTAVWGLLAIVGIALTGYFRGFGEVPTPDGLIMAALIQTGYAFDAPDNLSFILSRAEDWWFGDLAFAPTVQYMFLSPIPRALWPDKPLVMGNQYIMQRFLAERFTDESGEVISPSMAGEMLVSGGLWFVVVWSLTLGIVVTVVYRWTQAHRESQLALAVSTWLCLNMFNLLRSGTGIVSPMLTFSVMSAIALAAARATAAVARGAAVTEDHRLAVTAHRRADA